jgi:spore germination protein
MIIHVVQSGETIQSIADEYGVSEVSLVKDNDITNADQLAVGQAILIVYPNQIYTVQEGDSLQSIADSYGISAIQLLRNNPQLIGREFIYPGETVIINYTDEKTGNIATNGYAYPYIDRDILVRNLVYLTYLSVFSYSVDENGNLSNIDDVEIVNLARAYGVAPIMVVSNVNEAGAADKETLHNILGNQEVKDNFIANVLDILRTKGYYGVNIDTPYIRTEDRTLYFDFIAEVSENIRNQGYKVFITITPNSFETEIGTNYETVDFSILGQILDGIILLSYSWGYASDIPVEAIPSYILELLLRYTLTIIPPEKITIGISSIGYIWQLPNTQGGIGAYAISNTNAVQLASNVGAVINYNETNLSSYFYVTGTNNYLVYFHDVRGVDTSLKIMTGNGLESVGIWNIMYVLAQTFLLINSQYNIINVI